MAFEVFSEVALEFEQLTGSIWRRTRHTFLAPSRTYYYRSYPFNHRYRYTTPITPSGNYYYCTSSSDITNEIQCNTANGDSQCCEDETTRTVYCCGGNVDDTLEDDTNQTTQMLSRIFFTLATIALFMHLLMKRFHH